LTDKVNDMIPVSHS